MGLIDTHGHLNFGAFAETWEEVADRARNHGVIAVVMPGSQYPTSVRSVDLARERRGFLFAAVGLHPTHVVPRFAAGNSQLAITDQEKFEDFDFDRYLVLAQRPEVVAIGEVGLDSYRSPNLESGILNLGDWIYEQELVLQGFTEIAQQVKKPMILHCRGQKKPNAKSRLPTGEAVISNFDFDPHTRLIKILAGMPDGKRPRFVVHCYQGTVTQAEHYLALGGLISLTGTITYSDDPAVTEVVRAVPLDRLMLETDSPYLSPMPYRGEQNEPWKVVEVARRVATLRGVDVESVAHQTTVNARDFFALVQ